MKIFVKTLKGTSFEIEAKSDNTVADVKKNIEKSQGCDVYPVSQQMLIYQGRVLKDGTTLEENKVAEKSFLVIMLTKNKASSSGDTTVSVAPLATSQPQSNAPLPTQPVTVPQTTASTIVPPQSAPQPLPLPAPTPASSVTEVTDIYGQSASNLVSGSNLEATVQQIIDMGCGSWDRNTVVRALRTAYNNPERAIDYLYSGIPEQGEIPPVAQPPASVQPVNPSTQATQPATEILSGPNTNPLDLFPQGLPNVSSGASSGTLDFLRGNPQFQALRTMVQANPQILQHVLQELGKQNPQLVRMIREHQTDFLRLINEPAIEGDGNMLGQLAETMPQTVTVTPEERQAIERLEAMGFDRNLVLEVYFACNKNEDLAANYLLDHMHEFDDEAN